MILNCLRDKKFNHNYIFKNQKQSDLNFEDKTVLIFISNKNKKNSIKEKIFT